MDDIVYVKMPDGEPKPCRASSLGYALSLGYQQCDPPQPKVAEEIVAPEPVKRRQRRSNA